MTWQAGSLAVLAVALAVGFAWYERSRPQAKVLSLVAALAALAVVGRLAFAAIPNVKPTTDIVFFAGYALGPAPGFAVGAVTALASNVFLGQGPWTPWQMAAWGLVGIGGGLLGRALRGRELGRFALAVPCALAGAMFGAIMDTYQWTLAAEQNLDTWFAVSASSFPYNLAHVIGNVVFCLLIGPPFVRALSRYRRRFEVRWRPALAAPAVVLAGVLSATALLAPAPAEASSTSRAVSYLVRAQNGDGGFGGARGQASNQLHTGWAALGLAAAGRNPRDVQAGANSVIDYIRARAGQLNDVGELERTILVVRASGMSARKFDGRNLVAELLRRRRSDGSWRGNVTHTVFGVLALRSAGTVSGVSGGASWLARAQNGDGGFGFVPNAGSDVDDTGAVLQALRAAGRGGTVKRRAIAFLKAAQNRDGGFGQMKGRSSNAQSTAWAVQGLVAAGRNPSSFKRNGRTPLSYIRSLQRGDGSIRYSRSSAQTPVWVTAQALAALSRKAFPLRPLKSRLAAKRKAAREADAAADRAADRRRARRSGHEVGGPLPGGSAGGGKEKLGPPAPDVDRAAERFGAAPEAAADDGGGLPWLLLLGGTGVAAGLGLGIRRGLRRRAA